MTDLTRAFPPTPDACRDALSAAARSVREEPLRRKYPLAIVIAAILTLMTTVAIAEGWNVLHFLGIQPDSDATQLVQPVSASARAGNVTLTIDSILCDGEDLAFDWTFTNADPAQPVYLHLEGMTANGQGFLHNTGSDQISLRWLPGADGKGAIQGGYITPMAPWMSGDNLRVELVVGLYTPVWPIHRMDVYNSTQGQAKMAEGYVVIPNQNNLADPAKLLTPGADFNLETGQLDFPGTTRTELRLAFDVDMRSARASLRRPDLPYPSYAEHAKLELERFTVSPLQIRLTAVTTWADDAPVGLTGKFLLRDKEGRTIRVKDVSASPESYATTYGRSTPFTNKQTVWECAIIAPTAALPDEADLVFRLTDGTELSLPLSFR